MKGEKLLFQESNLIQLMGTPLTQIHSILWYLKNLSYAFFQSCIGDYKNVNVSSLSNASEQLTSNG